MYWKALVVLVAALVFIKLTYNTEEEFDPEKHVRGQNVLVTGASSGIGEQLAYTYARMGANVYITARREERLKKVVAKCKEIGVKDGKFGYTVADMEIHELAAPEVINAAVSLLGGLDQVILNHAYIQNLVRWNGTDDDMRMFEMVTEVNFMSYVHLASLSLPYLKKSYGKLTIISSMAGKLGMTYMAPYTASKFALDGFFSTLRREFLNHGENVSVTVCFPAMIETDNVVGIFDQFYKDFNVDRNKMEAVMTKGTLSGAAEVITAATALGHRECYYPPMYGGTVVWKILSAIRHLWPTIVEFDVKDFSN